MRSCLAAAVGTPCPSGSWPLSHGLCQLSVDEMDMVKHQLTQPIDPMAGVHDATTHVVLEAWIRAHACRVGAMQSRQARRVAVTLPRGRDSKSASLQTPDTTRVPTEHDGKLDSMSEMALLPLPGLAVTSSRPRHSPVKTAATRHPTRPSLMPACSSVRRGPRRESGSKEGERRVVSEASRQPRERGA